MSLPLLRSMNIVGCIAAALLLQSCGSSKSTSTPPPAPTPDFSLSASPVSLTIQDGGAASQVTVSAAAVNSFSGSVTVAVGGVPAGVAATPASFSVGAGSSQSV